MAVAYRVRDWSKHYENNRTRDMKHMNWVPIPNRLDGSGFRELVDHKNGPGHFAVWIILLEIASRCEPRGTLLRSTGRPLSVADISRMCSFPEALVEQAVSRLSQLKWIECFESSPQEPAAVSQDGAEIPQESAALLSIEGIEGIEGIEQGGGTEEAEFVAAWNSCDGIRKNMGEALSHQRRKSFAVRLKDKTWDWKQAIAKFPLKVSEGDEAWKPDLDWFLRPESVRLILEGKYDFVPNSRQGSGKARLGASQLFDRDAEAKDPRVGKL